MGWRGAVRSACLLLLMASCRAPNYFEVHVGASQGHGEFERSFAGIDEETYYLGGTLGWTDQDTNQAMRNMALLDINRAGELNTQEDHSGHAAPGLTVNLGDEAEEIPPEPDLTTKVVDALLVKPKPGEEWTYTIWILGFCAAVFVFFRVKRGGKS